jgi:hypothetical protein
VTFYTGRENTHHPTTENREQLAFQGISLEKRFLT